MTQPHKRNATNTLSIGELTMLILNKLQTRARLQEQQREEEQPAEHGEEAGRDKNEKAANSHFLVVA